MEILWKPYLTYQMILCYFPTLMMKIMRFVGTVDYLSVFTNFFIILFPFYHLWSERRWSGCKRSKRLMILGSLVALTWHMHSQYHTVWPNIRGHQSINPLKWSLIVLFPNHRHHTASILQGRFSTRFFFTTWLWRFAPLQSQQYQWGHPLRLGQSSSSTANMENHLLINLTLFKMCPFETGKGVPKTDTSKLQAHSYRISLPN